MYTHMCACTCEHMCVATAWLDCLDFEFPKGRDCVFFPVPCTGSGP